MQERITVLKQYEEQCFRICYYLLRCEALAQEAAQGVLLQIARSDAFFAASKAEQPQLMRKESMKQSLLLLRKRAR